MKVLVVDDERNIRESVRRILELEGFAVETAENGLSAGRLLEDRSYDVILSDQKMPGMTGIELLESVRRERRREAFIMMSAFGDISDAVEAMHRGAGDYIPKPFDPDDLVARLRRIENGLSGSAPEAGDGMAGTGPAMQALRNRIARISGSDATVLITGESGTGKEVTARYIHSCSPAAGKPFVAVNIGGVPENLLESELFGHERGAFTGADSRKKGLFETAAGGTLFLDEIGEMPQAVQVKMLRVLQERRIRRLGSVEEIPVDLRIITATNRKLEDEVKKGTFREDLFYRLNIVRLHLPPLRERREDIPELVSLFLARASDRTGRNINGMDADAMDRLSTWPFPGNIRELENIIERSVIYAEGDLIRAEDLDLPETGAAVEKPPETGSLKDLERRAIRTALTRWEGNRTRAAEELGISRRTILNKIGEYGL